MKLWLISQEANNDYDTYDSAVVAAKDENAARHTAPGGDEWRDGKWMWVDAFGGWHERGYWCAWTEPSNVTVELIGTAKPGTKAGVICASFNAG